jgi:hypothetical protein
MGHPDGFQNERSTTGSDLLRKLELENSLDFHTLHPHEKKKFEPRLIGCPFFLFLNFLNL